MSNSLLEFASWRDCHESNARDQSIMSPRARMHGTKHPVPIRIGVYSFQ